MLRGFSPVLRVNLVSLVNQVSLVSLVSQVSLVNQVNQVNLALKALQVREDLLVTQVTHRLPCLVEEMQRWWIQSLEEMLLKRPKTMY